jgi:hypothetical protein
MIEKYAQLIDVLVKKTSTGELVWKAGDSDSSFETVLAGHTVNLFSFIGLTLTLLDSTGRTIDKPTDDDIGEEGVAKLEKLFVSVRRTTNHVDDVLDAMIADA